MGLIGVIIACSLVAVTVVHLGLGVILARKLRRHSTVPIDGSELPKAGVILALRGNEPSLRSCLQGLFNQDYPVYRIEIIVDKADAAWHTVQEVILETKCSLVRVHALTAHEPTCSLKCSALVQGIGTLDASHEIIAFCDSDVVPHSTWLRELVAPLLDPKVGATTGNRWYAGRRYFFGSQARSAWNAAAVAQMSFFTMPWGGTLAIRRTTLDVSGLVAKWSRSFNDDLVLGEAVRKMGLELRLVPSLLMVERGECSLKDFRSFVFRQLIHLRFYLGSWPIIAAFGMLTTLLGPAALAVTAVGLTRGDLESAGYCGSAFLAANAILLLSYFIVESAVAAALQRYRRDVEPMGLQSLWAAPLAVCVHAAALLPAMVRRTVNWRGAIYRINNPWRVELVENRLPALDYPTLAQVLPAAKSVV